MGRPNITSREQAEQMGRKGGQSRSVAKQIINRKYCNASCPLWNACFAKTIAHSEADKKKETLRAIGKNKEANQVKALCALKKMPLRQFHRTVKLLSEGEKGYNDALNETMLRFANAMDMDKSPRALEKLLYQLRKNKKSIFGDRRRLDANISADKLTAEHFRAAWNKVKEELKDEVKSDEIEEQEGSA